MMRIGRIGRFVNFTFCQRNAYYSSAKLVVSEEKKEETNLINLQFPKPPSPIFHNARQPFPARDPTHTVEWFLKRIKRECDQFIDKFTSWDHLFTASDAEMDEMGLPLRVRRRIIRWTFKYRQGIDPSFELPSRKLILKIAAAKAAKEQNAKNK